MSRRLITSLILSSVAVLSSMSVSADEFYEYGRVISSDPIYEYDNRREKVCWDEDSYYRNNSRTRGGSDYYSTKRSSRYDRNSHRTTVRGRASDEAVAVGTVAGGVVGAAVGHSMANSRESQAATTIIGGVVGMVIGNSIARNADTRISVSHHHHGTRNPTYTKKTRQVCEYEFKRRANVIGYQVRYRFNGNTYVTNTRRDPGHQIRLRIEPMVD